MVSSDLILFEKLTKAGSLLTKKSDFEYLVSIIVEQTIDNTKSDIACLYMYQSAEKRNNLLKLILKRGNYKTPIEYSDKNELVEFIKDCSETLVLLERKKSSFSEVLLNEKMQSGIAIPIIIKSTFLGMLILNSLKPNFYNREKIIFLESFIKIAAGVLNNSQQLKTSI